MPNIAATFLPVICESSFRIPHKDIPWLELRRDKALHYSCGTNGTLSMNRASGIIGVLFACVPVCSQPYMPLVVKRACHSGDMMNIPFSTVLGRDVAERQKTSQRQQLKGKIMSDDSGTFRTRQIELGCHPDELVDIAQ